MRKFICLAIAALLCSSCIQVNMNKVKGKNILRGEGAVITQTFDFKDFDAICVYGGADIEFTQSDTWEVSLKTQENIFDHLDYKVEDGVLMIQAEHFHTIIAKAYDLTIRAPELRRIEVNGAGDVNVPAGIHSEGDIEIEVNGAGDLDFTGIVCRDLKIEANGAGDIDATGLDVQALKIEISGIGDVCVAGKAETATFDVAGIGDIDARGLTVAGEVNRNSAGIARIRVK